MLGSICSEKTPNPTHLKTTLIWRVLRWFQ